VPSISYCPYCGAKFDRRTGDSDSRIASGYLCTECDQVLELQVNRFPRARTAYH
jgi:transposase-like protein